VFTGLVADVGRVVEVTAEGDARVLSVATRAIDAGDLAPGESIAVDGVCLTVTERGAGRFRAVAGPETLARTTLGGLRAGARVNLERALRASDRLGGHIVAGHVDAVGTIAERRDFGPGLYLEIEAPREILRYVVEKGSIAVDGISLTVNRVDERSFAVALIPHTLEMTGIGDKPAGAAVNLEVDILGKYVEKLLARESGA
jgi:riboflavin synthase